MARKSLNIVLKVKKLTWGHLTTKLLNGLPDSASTILVSCYTGRKYITENLKCK